jgi:hypothetical protein
MNYLDRRLILASLRTSASLKRYTHAAAAASVTY